MNAQALAYRAAMSELIEFNLECADPSQMRKSNQLPSPPVEVNIALDLLNFEVDDNEYDLLQNEAENDFFQEVNEANQHSYGRSARNAW